MEGGALAGAIIGGIILFILVVALLLFFFMRWMKGPMKGSNNSKALNGKLVVITGANTGIGKATAEDLAKRGARVIILCRSVEKGDEAAAEIKENTGGQVEVRRLDLASLKSVRECAEALVASEDKIDILINNAGVMLCPHWKTEDGFDMQFGTNHLGHFLLTEMLMPLIRKSEASGFHPRIIILSSLAHKGAPINWDDINYEKSYSAIAAYAQSKLANVLHAKELAERLSDTEISVYAVHPGAVDTELGRHFYNKWWAKLFKPCASRLFKQPIHGAQTTLYCALDDSVANDSGKYYADCRETRPHSRALRKEDQKRLWDLSEKFVGLKE
ncbi:hypothetical protein TCAL_05730 [Tigriopus californicus]|uniref:Uncharacterized protein n=1 Tax=Tigriopus californicus TaxID=6832 RepID=A0A553N7Y6_TIGCA|nr:retinol dehydrogenase 12-like [Tigriopus californicus]XP_059088507.1 retinol dehydrogenase 12-like [Tigriopus californicus]TRY61533.1 hypothetical protein TCAL_05730 [Tigriopus californicus]